MLKKMISYPALVLFLFNAPIVFGQNAKIEGIVKFIGDKAPRNKPIVMGADPQCLNLNKDKKVYQESVVVNPNGTLKNVFVHIKQGLEGKKFEPPKEPVTLEQQECLYHPRVFGVMVGQKLITKNNDPTLHNVHAWSEKGNSFNVAQPIQGMSSEFVMKAQEVMLQIKCDVHPWMKGFAGVLPHPFFNVTDDQGHFIINNVPPGKYVVQAWQESFGAKTQEIEVKPGATVTLEFSYNGTEKAELNPGFIMQEITLNPDVSVSFVTHGKR